MITSFFSPKNPKKLKSSGTGETEPDASQASSPPHLVRSTPPQQKSKHARAQDHPSEDRMDSKKRTKFGVDEDNLDLPPHVTSLLSHLTQECWKTALMHHFASPGFASLAKFVESERANKTIYPPPCDTFSALNLLPLHKVKVVIVGQDPYHQPNQGHGLAFSVRKGVKIPPSLRNIYKELLQERIHLSKNQISKTSDINKDHFPSAVPNHGYLERWAKQGVLMLNAVLTVRKGEANSHANKGWEAFTDEIIRILDRRNDVRSRKQRQSSPPSGLVFLLWGKPASKKAEAILKKNFVRNGNTGKTDHFVICTSHPSPLGASKTKSPFLGSRCFSRANQALVERGLLPIDWNVDGNLDDSDDDAHHEEFRNKGKIIDNNDVLRDCGNSDVVISDV